MIDEKSWYNIIIIPSVVAVPGCRVIFSVTSLSSDPLYILTQNTSDDPSLAV